MRRLLVSFSALAVGAAWAEGPGTRIRTTPEIPQPMELTRPPVPRAPAKPCEGLRAGERERCPGQNQKPIGTVIRTNSGNAAANGGTAPR